tara:strand:- start:334 stop:669 length:336 start_codon:yes stop_codon:yes gene_type:complete
MKQYGNGQRPQKMYGGGMANPRKPMGGLAEQNRVQPTTMAKNMGATEPKRFSMGMNLGGAIAKFEGRQKKSNGGKTGAKPDYLDFDKDGNKKESMKQALAQRDKSKKKKTV